MYTKTENLTDTQMNLFSQEESFFEKLESVGVNYDSLGKANVNNVKYWCNSLKKYEEYLISLERFKKDFWEESKKQNTHCFKEYTLPDLETAKNTLRNNITTLMRNNFKIEPPEEMIDTLRSESFDFTSQTEVLDLLMTFTNNGDTDDIVKEQLMNKFSKFIRRREFKIVKNKITVKNAFNSYKCRIFQRHELEYSEHHKAKVWIKVFLEFAKERCEYPGVELFILLRDYRHEDDGIYEKNTTKSDVLVGLKLFKNGSLDLYFKTAELANEFAEEWIKPAQQ